MKYLDLWKGLGVLVLLIPAFVIYFVQLIVDFLFQSQTYYVTYGWPKLLMGLISAGIIWYIGKRFNNTAGKTEIDKKTGQEVPAKPKHTFFFIRMEYWAFAVAVIGVILAFSGK